MDSVVQWRGTIYEKGFGQIASKVMRDKTLPRQSRLIYAYICSFASYSGDGSRSAFPSVSLQCGELCMSEETYYKYRKPLEQKGLITIEKRKTKNNKFERNLYFIETVPIERIEIESDENLDIKGNEPYPKNSGTGKNEEKKPYPNFPSTEIPSTENLGTNNISSNNNIFNNLKDVNKIVNKVTLLDIFNSYYASSAPGRWSKEQWMKIADRLTDELLDDDGIFRKSKKPEAYIKGCLKKIMHHHDMKTGKKKFKYQGTEIPFYDWLSK